MNKFPLDDNDVESIELCIFRNIIPRPVELSAAPTTNGGELPNHLDNGLFGTNWYVNFFGTTLRFNGTAV